METLKKLICLNCGGDVTLSADGKSATCKYCKRTYKIGSTLSDNSLIAFSFAAEYWKNSRFTDAKRKFAEVTKSNPEFSEAWWGAFVSEYGIKFVKNGMGEKVPTCHRAHTVDVRKDENYRRALETASEENRKEYEELGEKIERVRQGIIEKSNDGEIYDVFICFKATEINAPNNKTSDYYLGRDIYYELTKAGYKVFFSSETLGRISEQEFEPYIFKALTTARVMLVLCSNNEKIESAWVKNEWGRYLDMRGGKGLIPVCGNNEERYNAYSLPEELRKLNAIEYDGKLFEKLKTKIEAYFPERVKEREEAAKKAKEAEYESRFAKERNLFKKQEEELAALKEMMANFQSSASKKKESDSEEAAKKREQEELLKKQQEEALKKQQEEVARLKEMMENLQAGANKPRETFDAAPQVQAYSRSAPTTAAKQTQQAKPSASSAAPTEPPARERTVFEKTLLAIETNLATLVRVKEEYRDEIEEIQVPIGITQIAGKAFEGCKKLKKVTFGGQETTIGNHAFRETALEEIELPDSLQTIGNAAFYSCASLKRVHFGKNLQKIGKDAFVGTALEEIKFPSSLTDMDDRAFASCAKLKKVVFPASSKLSRLAFQVFENSALETIELPKSISRINYRAFAGSALKSITIPCKNMMIDSGVFCGCEHLKEIELGDKGKITEIGEKAFAGTALESFTISNDVTGIWDETFSGCSQLKTINFSEDCKIRKIGEKAFAGTALESFDVPDSVTEIGENAFENCQSLQIVTLGKNLEDLPKKLFDGLPLKNISVSEKNKFYLSKNGNLYARKSKKLLRYVAGKQDGTFRLPSGYGVASGAFVGSDLQKVEYQGGEPLRLSGGAFEGGSIAVLQSAAPIECEAPVGGKIGLVTLPAWKDVRNAEEFFPKTTKFKANNKDSEAETAEKKDPKKQSFSRKIDAPSATTSTNATDEIFIINNGVLKGVRWENLKETLVTLEIPNTVKVIENGAFANAKRLSGVKIPFTVTKIGLNTFSNCENLTNVSLPSSLKEIYSGAFERCRALKKIVIPDGVQYIGTCAFQFCDSLESVSLPANLTMIEDKTFYYCSNLRSVKLPNKLSVIGVHAFEYSGLSQIDLPCTVSEIREKAFWECRALTQVLFRGEIEAEKLNGLAFCSINALAVIGYPYKGLFVPKWLKEKFLARTVIKAEKMLRSMR